ncbi:hypothetical protein M8C21_026316 [Ambrosia artemisiifolia]|uniref:Uncharacterized protein n=1 Tax=Ambrosia artemisiifolia TaxID=4212 RepID=A0AAD5GR47_AMBAR|nr:hypothetical protein M8C21_026316 [Ambrosia artemisiifolia]
MGGCFSDVSGGKAAVNGGDGGGHNLQQQSGPSSNVVVSGATDEAVDYFYRSKGLQPLYTRIEAYVVQESVNLDLSLSASKLRDLDIMSKSDPMAVVYAKKKSGFREELEEVGRTEVIMNNLNPMWIQKISVAFHFEMLNLKDQDFIGEANCVLSEIMTHRSRSVTLKLHGRNGHDVGNLGSITIHAEETIASKMAIEMRLRCSNLDNKDLFSKSDPFLRISRIIEAGSPIPICKTETVNNNLNPVWKPLCITMQQYVNKDNPLVIECFDFNSNGNHTLIGKLHTSIQDMENLYKSKAGANFVFPSSRRKDHEKVLKGKLFVDGYEEKELYSFLDYISSGFELNFMVAVDFTGKCALINYAKIRYLLMTLSCNFQFLTASNGDPRNRDSLHYMGYGSSLNAYQQVEGVQGIMAAYKNALHTVSLHGPTLFGQVINKAAEIAAQSLSTNPTKYFVLLIITDGVLTDLQETKDAIVKASDLPLSILIVGVGNADFKQMEILDADTGPRLESSTGRIATRDIVQFVPMRDVQHGDRSMVQALLEELPGQFLTYVRSRDIKPLGIDVHQAPLLPDPLIT